MTDDIIRAHDIHAWYGSSHILHGIDFHLQRGETVGLLGRNGMGKSTLIRSLLGHVKQRSGRIELQQQAMSGARPYQAARLGIAYVPEGRGIFPNLTVRENLLMCARTGRDGTTAWDFERILQTFPRLAERLDNMGDQLSGGEQQMLSIGRALMTNPDAIILDEATEGLAPLIVEEIWRVIGIIRNSGLATMVVDRNYRKVMDQADRLVVLEKGRVVLEGDARQLRSDPSQIHQYLGV
ncbi:ABC transporter ATP-binding protein [Advenella mimigardefordensis]|uniref:ABC transporter ATP-binding protein n=1 Tax=Advenella mimigardefordensis (strain DSM 17166 / LMG 22922 / DPN7) TaxID=1247726 RepID=W0PH79_ADVMD|nr:ABC transporter ATP-binding protein [Advenella mimigardefordensis]AHG64795.1 ABC transporter ATP-binding protein [Advenella mimigardefordensis DPN7]